MERKCPGDTLYLHGNNLILCILRMLEDSFVLGAAQDISITPNAYTTTFLTFVALGGASDERKIPPKCFGLPIAKSCNQILIFKIIKQPDTMLFLFKTRPCGYKTFFVLNSAGMHFFLLMNMNMSIIVGIFIFISREFFKLSYV